MPRSFSIIEHSYCYLQLIETLWYKNYQPHSIWKQLKRGWMDLKPNVCFSREVGLSVPSYPIYFSN